MDLFQFSASALITTLEDGPFITPTDIEPFALPTDPIQVLDTRFYLFLAN